MGIIGLLVLAVAIILIVAFFRPGRLAQTVFTVLLSMVMAVGIMLFLPLLAYEGGAVAAADAGVLILLPFIGILTIWKTTSVSSAAPRQPAPDRCTFPHCVCRGRGSCVVRREPNLRTV